MQKKVAKKAVKRDLEKTLRKRFLEVISQLGLDAEKVGDDISKTGKKIAKKLAKSVKKVKQTVGLEETPKVKKDKRLPNTQKEKTDVNQDKWTTKPEDAGKPVKAKRGRRRVENVDGVVPKAKPIAQSVKVTPISSEAHVKKALTKNGPANTTTPVVKKRASRTKPKTEVFPQDPEMPETTEPA
ncbi:hypothetical protein [Pedobacter sp.]|uniref:hypothetical protein n=1 Tax=Pedobacter sp. TaxID=1411316 RepID=UPI003D7F7B08